MLTKNQHRCRTTDPRFYTYLQTLPREMTFRLYTKIKISLNEQAQNRGPDPVMDEATKQEMKPRIPDWEFDTATSSPLEIVNTNLHTASYHFSTT